MLTTGKVYTVVSVEKGWYRIVDDSGEDYLYPPEKFTIVEDDIIAWTMPPKGTEEKYKQYLALLREREQYEIEIMLAGKTTP